MSEENVQVVRESLEAFNRGDIDALLAVAHEDVELVTMRSLLEGTSYKGHDGFREYMADIPEDWASLRVEAEEYRDLGDTVLILGRLHARSHSSALELDMKSAWLVEVRDGKVSRLRAYPEREQALEAVGELESGG